MNLKEIREIIKLMNDNELAEVEVEREGAKIKLKKTSQGVMDHMVAASVAPRAMAPAPAAAPAEAPVTTPASGTAKQVVSPMVGTFYRAPSPESPPFAELGQVVEVGQVVCIVEAMKLMNEIKSEIRGKVVRIAVENAEPVEFGQTLFDIEPV